jgi:hypothetical protein
MRAYRRSCYRTNLKGKQRGCALTKTVNYESRIFEVPDPQWFLISTFSKITKNYENLRLWEQANAPTAMIS